SDRTVRRYEAKNSAAPTVPQLVLDTLREIARRRGNVRPKGDAFTFIDLFAGIGGLRIPFEEIGGKCLFTAEWDRFSRETYTANFADNEDHEFAGDIRPYADAPQQVP